MIVLSALAYIDPGTGALILQAVVAAALTGGIVLRRVILWPLARLFGYKRPEPPPASDESGD